MGYKKIYLCVTNRCNLACKGCYKNSGPNANGRDLDLNSVRDLLNEYVSSKDDVECVFHGGEPFFKKDDETINNMIQLVTDYPQLKWSATTNLVYNLTGKILTLFNLFDEKLIKTSWDVDNYRFQTSQMKSLWEENVKTLLEKDFDVQVIITLNKETLTHEPSEILEYMKNLGVRNINFERITETGRAFYTKVKPLNKDIDEWLTKAYLQNAKTKLNVVIFDELKNIINGIETNGCRQRKCMQNVITINPDGTIATCPNISDKHIGTIVNGKACYTEDLKQQLIKKEQKVSQECSLCQFYAVCHGECCQLESDETGCPGLKKLIETMLEE